MAAAGTEDGAALPLPILVGAGDPYSCRDDAVRLQDMQHFEILLKNTEKQALGAEDQINRLCVYLITFQYRNKVNNLKEKQHFTKLKFTFYTSASSSSGEPCKDIDLFNIALELLVSNGQRVEELLQDDCGALLPGIRGLVHKMAFLVEHQLSAHLT